HLHISPVVLEEKGFHDSGIQCSRRPRKEWIARQVKRPSRNRVSPGPENIRRIQGVNRPSASESQNGCERDMLQSIPQPRRSASPLFHRQLKQGAGGQPVSLVLARMRPVFPHVERIKRLFIEVGGVVPASSPVVSDQKRQLFTHPTAQR